MEEIVGGPATRSTRNALDCHTRALMALTKGDAAYRAKDCAAAAEQYTLTVALAGLEEPDLVVSALCRRASCYLYLKKLKPCVDDCNAALAVDSSSFRAHVVRCLANIYLSNFSQALEDHAVAVARCGGNVVLMERLEDLRASLEVARAAAVYAATRGSSVAPLADWIGDFNLLGLEGADVGGKRRRESLQGLPKLIPIGEWMGADVCEQLLDYTSYKLTDKAMKEKQKGNAEFAGGNFVRALQLYTRAIKLNPEEGLYYSNRALVYLRLQRYEEAVSDCSASLARQPTIKAYARRALAYDSLHMHVEAAHDHRAALQFEPRNPVCLNAFRDCLVRLLQLPNVSEEERARAQRELEELVSVGRLSNGTEPGLNNVADDGGLSLSSSSVGLQMSQEKKKRGAGGL